MFKSGFTKRWKGKGGYREFFVLSIPLILSSASWAIQNFIERMYLAWYSPETIAAATPAGILNFSLLSIFIGTASYTGTFVAQYHGAGMHREIGRSIGQAMYLSVLGAIVVMACIPLAGPVFTLIGHDPVVQHYEIEYFQLLCLASFPVIASAALGSSFTSMGRPWTVLLINALATLVSLFLGYLFIFGKMGFPEMGIRGAAYATIFSACISFVCFLVVMGRKNFARKFHPLAGLRFDATFFKRLLHFGFPSGIQFAMDMAGVTLFVLLIGRLGTSSLAATNIALNLYTLVAMPMVGSGYAICVLVGRYIGMQRTDLAERTTYSGMQVTALYFGMAAAIFLLFPHTLVNAFAPRDPNAQFAEVAALAVTLLRFIAFYSLFNGLSIIFASALKGAGDTHYVMRVYMIFSFVVAVPIFILVVYFKSDVITCWCLATACIIIASIFFIQRFLGGTWKDICLIERPAETYVVPTPDAYGSN